MTSYENLIDIQSVQAAITVPSILNMDVIVPFGCFA